MKFEIKNRFDGSIIFSLETSSMKLCVEAALKSKINLRYADLSSADLRYADLSYADLSYADLRSADLRSANLRYANLRYANLRYADLSYADQSYADLSSADLRSANLRYANLADIKNGELIIAQQNICPIEGAFVGWKKLQGNFIARLVIPHDAERMNSIGSRKCRASKAFVHEIFGAKEAYDKHSGKLLYKTGEEVIPDKYDPDLREECSHGIHFFITRIEAENYSN